MEIPKDIVMKTFEHIVAYCGQNCILKENWKNVKQL